jgi:hypothetical protein
LTGLPTEIIATKILTDNQWSVENEHPYTDNENNKVRTLDVKATKIFAKKDNSLLKTDALHCELYIECKKSSKPWVFYLDTMTRAELKYNLKRKFGDAISSTFIQKKPSILSEIPLGLDTLNYKLALSHQIVFVKTEDEKSTLGKAKKAEDEKDEIYSAEMQIFKALNNQERLETDTLILKRRIVVPIILLSGRMFGCYFEDGVLKTPEIQYTRHLAHGLPNQQIPAILDVVTLNYFPEYIKLLTQEVSTKV